jgi:hypothetical protein
MDDQPINPTVVVPTEAPVVVPTEAPVVVHVYELPSGTVRKDN